MVDIATPSPNQKILVVILHGYTIKVSKYKSLEDFIKVTFRNADIDIIVPKLSLKMLSTATYAEVTNEVLKAVDELYDPLSDDVKTNTKIILIGHSTGALFARKAFLVACNAIDSATLESGLSHYGPKPWAKNVERLILLGGINRGWTLSGHLKWYRFIQFCLGIGMGSIISLFKKEPIVFQTRGGSAFITHLNEAPEFPQDDPGEAAFKNALTIQLIGIQDDVVSPEDNIAFNTERDYINRNYVYLEMQYSDHFNIIDLNDVEEGESRKKLIGLSLTENKENLQKLRPSNLSLPLIDVLEEEYDYLYDTNPAVKEEATLQFKKGAAALKLIKDKIERIENGALTVSAYETTRLKKLQQWVIEDTDPEKEEDVIHQALNAQLENHDLILKETWMEEANLRPYTQGLVKNFKKRIREKNNRLVNWSKEFYKSTDIVCYEYAFKDINRLVLEDVYGDVLERTDDVRLKDLFEKLYQKKTNALCLSGGGIRSGTFALGVLQGLATVELPKEKVPAIEDTTIELSNGKAPLTEDATTEIPEDEAPPTEDKEPAARYIYDKITYLSTVSGGGYIGGWLSTWLHQEKPEQVFEELSGKSATLPEPAPLQYVRQYSNFLSPVVGIFSADTWTLFAIYLRNMVLNWLIIIPFMVAVVALPWLTITVLNQHITQAIPVFGIILGAILLIYSDWYTKKYPPRLLKDTPERTTDIPYKKRPDQGEFLLKCLLPGSVGFFLWAISWYWFNQYQFSAVLNNIPFFERNGVSHYYRSMDDPTVWQYGLVAGFTFFFVLIEWVLFWFLEQNDKIPRRFNQKNSMRNRAIDLGCLAIGGLCYGALLVWLFSKIPVTDSSRMNLVLYACLAFPLMLLLQLFIGFLYEGLKSNFADDPEREWRARYSGWFLIVALGWLVVSALILFVPYYLESRIEYTLSFGAITGYLTAYLGSKAGKGNPVKAKDAGNFTKVFSYFTLPVLAFIAFLTLLVLISQLDILLISKIVSLFNVETVANKASNIVRVSPLAPFLLFGLSLGLGGLFSYFIGSNRFSLHAMYRSRLIRAFLGAARPHGVRAPDPFTGFDEADNMYMGSLARPMPTKSTNNTQSNDKGTENQLLSQKPFHIINIALNLSAGKNLAWQERKAASFTVSPLHAGSGYLGYRHTFLKGVPNAPIPEKSTNYYGGERGISLGTAMTISGAAVSPNWGYHTSTLVAFFMTLFNLRLGSWLGNPGPAGDNSFNNTSPRNAIKPILSEMFGMTDDQSEYVYLSDGGHFENLGLYEMVLRRNRFIIVSDGSCDDKCELEDLGNAIRKIRIDLGVEIDFPLGFNIGARAANLSDKGRYWALGRIRYPENEYESIYKTNIKETFRERDAVLLYIKPGIYGNEPKDIFNYASVNLAFPHESTADQFFSESQFESYRALGFYVVERIKEELKDMYGISIADLFDAGDWGTEVIDKLNNPIKPPTNGKSRKLPLFQRYAPNRFYTNGR